MTNYSRAVLLALALAAAACETGFLDPELAGVWGGQNMELRIEADHIRATLLCQTTGTFPGDVRLDSLQAFERNGLVRNGPVTAHMKLVAWLAHPDTLMATIYAPGPLVDPAPPIPLVRGKPGDFDSSLILCAQ